MFYAANNSFGSSTDVGFCNTWDVLAFATRADRDNYVANGNLSTRAIKRSEITGYIYHKPQPFTGQHYAIVDNFQFALVDAPTGYVGHVEVSEGDMSIGGTTPGYIRKLNA